MSRLVRLAGLAGIVLVAFATSARAATPKEIDRSIKGGTDALKARYGRAGAPAGEHGIGGTCLAGLALLEAGTPRNDPAIKAITAIVRDASYKQKQTYQVALCLIYLDRYGDTNDVPLIQMLAVRLLVGQTSNGGWGYGCVAPVPADDEKRLRAMKADQPAGTLHPEIKKYGQALTAAIGKPGAPTIGGDDNSNTQFAVLAVWAARKHGVPVEQALDLILVRFMKYQNLNTGNWSYSGPMVGGAPGSGSPSMYCAGLLGMATGIARREDRRLKVEPPAKPEGGAKPPPAPSDPFAGTGDKPAPKKPPARAADALDVVVQRAFAGLGLTFADQLRKGLLQAHGGHGTGDLYFLWSMERVGVIYGVDKIGGFDWYDLGSTVIVRTQGPDGSWTVGGYGAEVNTAFAVLFLCRSNLARDLSGKVQKDPTSTEMRAGTGPAAADLLPNRPAVPDVPVPVLNLPNPTGRKSIAMASETLKLNGGDWAKRLIEMRNTKGSDYTHALTLVATNTTGDRKKAVRNVLAERLCRMTPATLRAMLKAEDAELRRAAALACAMKADKAHIPDLIAVLTDADDSVVRAAKAGLKSLTDQDFGPASGGMATTEKASAAAAWRKWYDGQKK